jgi:DNA-binding response OmpR family regulator
MASSAISYPVMTVLLVDDHADLRDTWAMLLELHGFHVRTACDGIEGVRLAQELRPALILTDLMMPGLDGLDLSRAIRADAQLKATPIILWTAAQPPRIDGLADVVLQKPVLIDSLLNHIRVLLDGRRTELEAP